MNSKRKGNDGERELCRYLTDSGFPAHRNDQMYVGGFNNPDVEAEGLERFHFEVKRVERLNVAEAMRQAEADSYNKIPAVVHRRNHEPWLITLPLNDFLREVGHEKQNSGFR